MRILITGGGGFLGGAFAVRARAAGYAVITADRQGDADHLCDIGDPAAVVALFEAAAPEIVVHLAAALTDAAAADVVAATRVNALGTAAVFAEAVARRLRRVVHASSVAAIGPCAEGSGDDVALNPRTIYGATKAFGEHLARAMHRDDGTRFLALRFGWVYGPGRARGWRVAQEMIERFAAGDAEVPYPAVPEAMDWTYVDDAAEVLLRAAVTDLPGFAALNVVGDKRPIRDAAAHLQARFPQARAVPVPAEAPASGWGIRNDGLFEALGHVPGIGLEQGIDRMLAASRSQPA
jgi:UDP-glucose 4-epimerase